MTDRTHKTYCCGIEICSWQNFFAFFETHLKRAWLEDRACERATEDPA